ncbi:TPA: hypothetical protein ACOL2E_003640 [Vibrio parahaemolyticus]
MSKKRLSEKELTINIDDFVRELLSSVESLPTKDLELSDLSNELGMVIARLYGSEHLCESEVLSGICHGFDLVRWQDSKPVGNEII